MKIFVYGTLKKKRSACSLMTPGEYISSAKIKNGKMFTNGSYPMVVKGDSVIQGELWEVPKKTVYEVLDRYEGSPFLFRRTPLKKVQNNVFIIEEDMDKPDAFVYIYQLKVDNLEEVPNGTW